MRDADRTWESEERLTGGNTAELVIRLGATIRKTATRSTLAVQNFVAHLRAQGFQAAPKPLGLDDQGRQMWEYVPGPLWHHNQTHTPADLRRVGAIIRELHGSAATFQPPKGAEWNHRYELKHHELVCHNDLAPWNLVCGEDRWAFIDWDAAAPASRLWDLAWAAISFPPFEPGCNLVTAAAAMHALLRGYDLDRSGYGELIRLMATRARAEYNLIVAGAGEGRQPWVRLHAQEHHNYWGPVADYLDRHASTVETLLNSLDRATHGSSATL